MSLPGLPKREKQWLIEPSGLPKREKQWLIVSFSLPKKEKQWLIALLYIPGYTTRLPEPATVHGSGYAEGWYTALTRAVA